MVLAIYLQVIVLWMGKYFYDNWELILWMCLLHASIIRHNSLVYIYVGAPFDVGYYIDWIDNVIWIKNYKFSDNSFLYHNHFILKII